MRGERRGTAGTLRTPLIFWNQITGSELLIVAEGRCRSPSPDAALVKAPLRIAAPLFVEAASSAFQGTDIRAFRLRGGTRATPVSAVKTTPTPNFGDTGRATNNE